MAENISNNNSNLRQRATGIESASLPREKLPSDLQKLVDDDESLIDQLYDGT